MKRERKPHFPTLSDGQLLERHRECLRLISYGRVPGVPPARGKRAWVNRYARAIRQRALTPLQVKP